MPSQGEFTAVTLLLLSGFFLHISTWYLSKAHSQQISRTPKGLPTSKYHRLPSTIPNSHHPYRHPPARQEIIPLEMDWTASAFDPDTPANASTTEKQDIAPSPSYSWGNPPSPTSVPRASTPQAEGGEQQQHRHQQPSPWSPPTTVSACALTPERENRNTTTATTTTTPTRSPSPVLSIPGSWWATGDPTRETSSPPAAPPPPSRPRGGSTTMGVAETATTAATAAAGAAPGPAPPPVDVPRPWQHAMSMVSVNAGLTPQFLLHAYYRAVAGLYRHHGLDCHGHHDSHHQHHQQQSQQQQHQRNPSPPASSHDPTSSPHRAQPQPLPDRGWVHLDLLAAAATPHPHHHRRGPDDSSSTSSNHSAVTVTAAATAATQAHRATARARARGIRGVRVAWAGGDPGRVYLLAISIDEVDPATGRGVVRLVTNTSVRHVLGCGDEGEGKSGEGVGVLASCADCPLWLPVRLVEPGALAPPWGEPEVAAAEAAAESKTAEPQTANDDGRSRDENTDTTSTSITPYQLIPCCGAWVDAMDFTQPLSAEEEHAPGVVDRLLREVRRLRRQTPEARDGDVERARRRRDAMEQQYWCAVNVAAILALMLVIIWK